MAGTLVGISNAQQNDNNGRPLANCLLTIFAGGTTTPSLVYQDIGLVLPAPNPLVGDLSGRIPPFYLADGIYHVRLTDQFGQMSNGGFDIPQIPSIGASTSGGGGSAVDPTTIAATGDVKFRLENTTISGWVRLNGRTIGSASSGASERANADTQALFIYAWNTYSDAICPVLGGRGVSGLADFNANKQITLLDARGRAVFGLDDMGNAAIGAFTNVAFAAGNNITGGSTGGVNQTFIVASNIPSITSSTPGPVTVSVSGTKQNFPITAGGISSEPAPSTGGNNVPISGAGGPDWATGSSMTTGAPVSVTSTNTGGQAFPSVPRALLGTVFWKL